MQRFALFELVFATVGGAAMAAAIGRILWGEWSPGELAEFSILAAIGFAIWASALVSAGLARQPPRILRAFLVGGFAELVSFGTASALLGQPIMGGVCYVGAGLVAFAGWKYAQTTAAA